MPVIVKILAEQVQATDFVLPNEALDHRLNQAMVFIRDDGNFGASVPNDILTASREMKLFVIECYREATGLDLTPGALPTRRFSDMMQATLAFDEEVRQPPRLPRDEVSDYPALMVEA